METILDKDTAKSSTKVKRTQLQAFRMDFENLHMMEGESVDYFFARTLTIANEGSWWEYGSNHHQ
ncbi:hypothetical protein CR513_05205, partial [Mucuna pruriens]